MQALASSQSIGLPRQMPLSVQTSLTVQPLPSSHALPTVGLNVHLPAAHASVVQALPSLQTMGAPAQVDLAVHLSSLVQEFLSSQATPVFGLPAHLPVAPSQ